MTEEVKLDNPLQYNYYTIFMFHRFVFVGMLIFLYTVPYVQIALILMLSLAHMLYIFILFPHKLKVHRYSFAFDELTIIGTCAMFFFLVTPLEEWEVEPLD